MVLEILGADNVLLFGGTAALCANTQYEVSNFTSFDYIGAPWNSYQGRGGEGGITIRKRSVMEALTLQFEKDTLSGKSTGTAREDTVIVRSLVDRKAQLASKEVCVDVYSVSVAAYYSLSPSCSLTFQFMLWLVIFSYELFVCIRCFVLRIRYGSPWPEILQSVVP